MIENNESKQVSFKQGIIPVITMAIFILMAVLVWQVPIHLALFFELTVTILLAMYWGFDWDQIEEMLFSSFKSIGNVIIILLLIGMMIGVWIGSGTVPSMIYYGIKVLHPQYFLVLSFVITSLVSMAVGTAIGTASTIGLALISIAQGFGLPLPLVAGAIISGCYVGDRMSPVSSIAVITAHSAETNLMKMIKHMAKSVFPPYLISFILYLIIGLIYLPGGVEVGQVQYLLNGLDANFVITLWLLLPPILIIILAIKQTPTVLNLIINIFASILLGILVSKNGWVELLNNMFRGVNSQTGIQVLDNLLARGGLTSMLELISLIIFAVLLGGLFKELGVLNSILDKLIKVIHNKGQLISITMASSAITAMLGCNQFLAVFLPSQMMGKKFDELNVPRKDLGRALGDSGLILSPMIPWNVNALMMTGVLGVSTLRYFPFAFLPLLLPITGIILGFMTNSNAEKKG